MHSTSFAVGALALVGLITYAQADEIDQSLVKFGQVVRVINEQPGKPDQFSTTAEHQAFAAKVAASMELLNPLEMVVPCNNKYTPDLERFEVTIELIPIAGQASREPEVKALDTRTIRVGVLNLKKSKYVGQNGYGAEVTIQRSSGDYFYLASPIKGQGFPPAALKQQDLGPAYGQFRLTNQYRLQLDLQMSPEQARTEEKNLQCKIIFRVAHPFLLQADEYIAPTRTWPYEIFIKGYALFGAVEKLSVGNAKSGKVYAEAVLTRE